MLNAKQKLLSGEHPILAAAVDRILSALPPDLSGAGRVQYLGVLLAIILIDAAGRRATVNAVEELTSMHATHVTKLANQLIAFGVLEREKTVASHGMGRQFVYHPVMNLSEIVVEASHTYRERDAQSRLHSTAISDGDEPAAESPDTPDSA